MRWRTTLFQQRFLLFLRLLRFAESLDCVERWERTPTLARQSCCCCILVTWELVTGNFSRRQVGRRCGRARRRRTRTRKVRDVNWRQIRDVNRRKIGEIDQINNVVMRTTTSTFLRELFSHICAALDHGKHDWSRGWGLVGPLVRVERQRVDHWQLVQHRNIVDCR